MVDRLLTHVRALRSGSVMIWRQIALDNPTELQELGGWWHTWFDIEADPDDQQAGTQPSAGWGGMDVDMESVPVPGSWAEAKPGYRGVAWHWRPFVVPSHWDGWTISLRFEGIRRDAQVYVNRRLAGSQTDGPRAFAVDVTDRVRPGGRYTLFVRVAYPPRESGSAASEEDGGICGPVSLTGTRPPAD